MPCINRQGVRGVRINLGMFDWLWGYKGKKKVTIRRKHGVTTRLRSFTPKMGLVEAKEVGWQQKNSLIP